MSRSKPQKRSNSSRRKATTKRFGMEAMEARRLLAGDFAVAVDATEIESVRPIAVVVEGDTAMPQTREHILLGRQVGVPSAAASDAARPDDVDSRETEQVAGANPMDLKRGIDGSMEFTVTSGERGEGEGRGEKGDVEGDLCSNEGVTVETPCDVLGPGVDPDAGSGNEMPNGNPHGSADEVQAPEGEGEGGDVEGDLCSNEGVTVETPCDVLGPGVDPDAGSGNEMPNGNPHGSADEVQAPEGEGEGGDVEGDLCSNEGVTVETPCDVLGPGVDPDAGSGNEMPNGNPHGGADEVLAPEEESGFDANPLPGDVDGDGVVGVADFLLISKNYGDEVDGRAEGDLNGDGVVNIEDFLELSNNFGAQAKAIDEVFASLA